MFKHVIEEKILYIRFQLCKKKIDFSYFNQRLKNKETALHISIKYHYNELSLMFINLGADLDFQDLVII